MLTDTEIKKKGFRACQCLILDKHPELIGGCTGEFVSEEVDLNQFIHLCSNRFVLPLVYLRLKNARLLEGF